MIKAVAEVFNVAVGVIAGLTLAVGQAETGILVCAATILFTNVVSLFALGRQAG